MADFGTGEPLAEGQWQLQGGVDGVVETTTAELAALFSLGEADAYVTVTGSGDPVEKAQAGEVVLTGGGANYTVESTSDSVVTLLNSTPAVADRLTASGSGSTPLQALPSTPLSGGVARASVVTAAALVALFQGVSSVAEAMMAEVTGDPAALVQPAQVYLSGGVEPASTSTVNEVVALLNGTPEVTALFETTGSGETIVGAGSASLSGGGEQATLTGTRTYGWDVHGRLAQVSLPGGQVHSYSYDYRTRRIGLQQTASGTDPAKTTAVVFSGGLSLAEYESTTAQATIASPGQSTVRYVRGPDMGGGVGGLLYSRRAQAVKFNLSNGRGDIVAQSDTSGALTWTASYEAYGKRTKETGENLDKQRGNSKDEDPTGLLNEGFRYRDLETGVWLSRDPAGFVDGPNVYAYVKQNPWTGWDPDGLKTKADYQTDYDNAKARYDELGKTKTKGTSVVEGLRIMKEMHGLGKEMKKAKDGISKIEATAKNLNQCIEAMNWTQRVQGKAETNVRIDGNVLDDESADHRWAFQASDNWSKFKYDAASTAVAGGLGAVAKMRGLFVATAGSKLKTVTSWADAGITPDLNPGRWVQLGDPTRWNYFKTGLGGPKIYRTDQFPFFTKQSSQVPFSNSVTGEVPASSLQWPSGWEKIKGILGQRQIKE